MKHFSELQALVEADRERMRVLGLVRDLGLSDCWVAAGFVRNLVWDHAHGRAASPLTGDIDVIWFDPEQPFPEADAVLEKALGAADGKLVWSVKNQARMHRRNGDGPYLSATDAMRYWPDTATAVGIRLDRQDDIELAAPYGLADLFDSIVRPTERFQREKHAVFAERIRSKQWQAIWPGLTIDASPAFSAAGPGQSGRD